LAALTSSLLLSNALAADPARVRRADAFLGIHFDFHAGPDCTEIGKNTSRAMIENIINQVHPDYLQIDCKGHRGLSSYPTKVGNPAPGFVGDPLKLWRQITAERGVSLYMHYSGVWDSEAIIQHPDWAAVNADGKINPNATSFFSPYADRLLLPQLRELAGDYGVDGVWIDGECWASVPDYGPQATQAFRNKTGIQVLPKKPSEPAWFEWLEFNRDLFRTYLRRNVAEMKRTHPRFEVCSNWAFTDHMPEQVSVPMDFLSGDYSPEDSVNSARLSARFLARQGTPWDLMAWSFTTKPGKNGGHDKSAIQLQREAAVVLALGGGFQAYFSQRRDGSIREERLPVMAEVARFCRDRQSICHHAVPVPQIALLYSTPAHYRRVNGLFSRDSSRLAGTLNALLEDQRCVEILSEHQLKGRLAEYPLVIVPECDDLDPRFKLDLIAYVRNGGNLLLTGPKTAALFEPELDILLEDSPASNQTITLRNGKHSTALKSQIQSVRLGTKASAYGSIEVQGNQPRKQPAASITALGRGRIAATYTTLGQAYLNNPSEPNRAFLNDLTQTLFPKPILTVSGSHDVDVSLAQKNQQWVINLVNTSGPHRSEPIIDRINPIGPLLISVRLPKRPASVTAMPGATPLKHTYHNGTLEFTLPSLDLHTAIAITPKRPSMRSPMSQRVAPPPRGSWICPPRCRRALDGWQP